MTIIRKEFDKYRTCIFYNHGFAISDTSEEDMMSYVYFTRKEMPKLLEIIQEYIKWRESLE